MPQTPADEDASDAVEAAIVARYLAFWEAVVDSADPPDPDHPGLHETAADPQLERLRQTLTEYHEQGVVRRGEHVHNPVLRELVDGARAAIIVDCVELDPEGGLFEAETGERVTGPGEPSDRQLAETRMELIDGTWKVVRVSVVEEESECVPGEL